MLNSNLQAIYQLNDTVTLPATNENILWTAKIFKKQLSEFKEKVPCWICQLTHCKRDPDCAESHNLYHSLSTRNILSAELQSSSSIPLSYRLKPS